MADKKLHVVFGILLIAILVQLYLKHAAAGGVLDYRGSWAEAVEEAEKTDKPIFLFFGGDWCNACSFLEMNTLSNEKVKEIARSFVTVKIDPRETQDAVGFKVTNLVPEVVLLSSSQKVLGRMESRTVDGVTDAMNRALAKLGGGGSKKRRR